MNAAENIGMGILLASWEAIKADPMSQAGLAHAVACKARPGGCESDDVHQAALVGLLEAVARFDPLRGNLFSTYATWWINKEIKALFPASCSASVRPAAYWQALKACRTTGEDMPASMARGASLDSPRVEDGRTLGDSLGTDPDQDNAAEVSWQIAALLDVARVLQTRAKDTDKGREMMSFRLDVLAYRIAAPILGYEPLTLDQIGRAHDTGRERARQVEADVIPMVQTRLAR